MGIIIHFDISADDLQRARHFYEEMFGWKFEQFPGGPQEYFLIDTSPNSTEKGLTGGMAKREKEYQKITDFIQVDSMDESIAKLEKLGGKVIEPKTYIPTVGFIAGCEDTERNIIGLIELEKNENAVS
ncbi:MAG: VOC family protein [Saprospiraceae bacterium]|nr:VOC family protein [Saprospiraceae bacterium]